MEIDALGETTGLDGAELGAELDRIAQQVGDFNARGMKQVLGISPRDAGLGARADIFREQNLLNIRSLLTGQIQDLRGYLEAADTVGMRVEDLADIIKERFSVAQSRADLIARDQVLTLNAQVTKERQTRAGVDQYVWTTAGDERVRDEHAVLDGQTFDWISGSGEEGNPGDAIMCRCIAFPLIPELDDPEE